MKSLSTSVKSGDDDVRAIGAPVHEAFAAWRTALSTRLPAGFEMSYVKQSPDTCGNRPCADGISETPFSRNVFSSAPPWIVNVNARLPNGSTASTWPREIGYGGGTKPGQK